MIPAASLRRRIIEELCASDTDFLLEETLADRIGAPVGEIRKELLLMPEVRQPVHSSKKFDAWWRLKAKGLTGAEKVERIRCLIGFLPMRDNSLNC